MFFLFILLAVVVIAILIFLSVKTSEKVIDVKIGNKIVKAEVADTALKRMKGLMNRKFLPEDHGMFFVFDEEDLHRFWMFNTSIPLDIIWIDKNHKIVDIIKDAKPCLINCKIYTPKAVAMYVLEVNANYTEKFGIKIGDRVEFTLR